MAKDKHMKKIDFDRFNAFIWLLGWMKSTAISWSQYADCNVCCVDWSRLANYDYSIAAMRHTKMVAKSLVYFMEFLIENGMNIPEVAIMGHSLGS